MLDGLATCLAVVLSTYFVLAAFSLYWLTAAGAALVARVLPRAVIERAPLVWVSASSLALAAATQTIPEFFPDYSRPHEILAEVTLWIVMGFFARCYLIYTDYPATFDGLRQSIEGRPLERWIAGFLNQPIDAVFTRIWVANSIAMIPVLVLVCIPSTLNYFVIAAYGMMALLTQFPHELADHTNIHTRIFQPKLGASPRVRRALGAVQVYFETILSMMVGRSPHFYRVQHVYVHHVEGNGPLDSQTTEPYDRTSFVDFSRHALKQGVDLVTGVSVIRYLHARGKLRQSRDMIIGLVVWWALIILLATVNPLGAVLVFVTRFIGGNIQSLVAFWQHGLVDPDDPHSAHGSTIDFDGPEHGNLGNDYHVEHHLVPGRHWSAYYQTFETLRRGDGGHQAIVLHKDVFSPLTLIAALWRCDHAAIAAHARLTGVAQSDQTALAQIVRQRTRPIGVPERTGLAARLDRGFSALMARALPSRFHV